MDKVYLIGLPGAGKTETGKWLAKKLNWDFADLDEMVENSTGRSIAEIFSSDGEEAFRLLERKALEQTFDMNHCVISCGGGTPEWYDNMDRMAIRGLTIYLNTDLRIIADRLVADLSRRPLFEMEDGRDIMQKLEAMAVRRRPYYSRAKVVWNKPAPEEHFFTSVNTLLTFYSNR